MTHLSRTYHALFFAPYYVGIIYYVYNTVVYAKMKEKNKKRANICIYAKLFVLLHDFCILGYYANTTTHRRIYLADGQSAADSGQATDVLAAV